MLTLSFFCAGGECSLIIDVELSDECQNLIARHQELGSEDVRLNLKVVGSSRGHHVPAQNGLVNVDALLELLRMKNFEKENHRLRRAIIALVQSIATLSAKGEKSRLFIYGQRFSN